MVRLTVLLYTWKATAMSDMLQAVERYARAISLVPVAVAGLILRQ